jgi:hypothetical protein
MNRLSNGGLNAARDCKRKFHYRYDLGLQRRGGDDSAALNYGKLWHKVLARWFAERNCGGMLAFIKSHARSEDDVRRCMAMLAGYAARWQDFPTMSLSEQEIDVPIRNPATGRRSQRFTQFGFMDMLWWDGRTWLYEHKTAASIGGGYLEKLFSDSQITGYYAALRDMGIDVEGVVYDVALKPKLELGTLRPTHCLSTAARDIYVTEQKTQWAEFGGKGRWKKKDYQAVSVLTHDRADSVAADQFYERLTEWHMRPEAYHREEVYISDRQVADWREDVWMVTQEILAARRAGMWPRNTSRCFDYYRPCEYVSLCQNGAPEALINSEYELRESPSNNDIQQTEKPVF